MPAIINQRDVFLLPFPFDTGTPVADHPFIVLSIQEANAHEQTFIAVMITSTNRKDDLSFELTDDMFEKKLDKIGCHVRMHLLTLYLDNDIRGKKINEMKQFYFNHLMKAIGELVFNYNFSPL